MHFALIYDGLKFFALHTAGVFLHGAPERERVAYAAVKRQCGARFIPGRCASELQERSRSG
jgi:hypothetical protein